MLKKIISITITSLLLLTVLSICNASFNLAIYAFGIVILAYLTNKFLYSIIGIVMNKYEHHTKGEKINHINDNSDLILAGIVLNLFMDIAIILTLWSQII